MAWSSEAQRRPAAVQLVRAVDLPPGDAGTWRSLHASFTLAAHHPIALGHYPGHPIVPGTCLLEAALQAVEHALPPGEHTAHALCGIEALQLERPAHPGEAVELEVQAAGLAPDGLHRWRVAFESGGRRLARATLVTGERGAGAAADTPAWRCGPDWALLAPADVAARLPHRAPMLLVDRAARAPDGLRLVAERTITLADCCYAEAGHRPASAELAFPPLLVLESMAQAAGLLLLDRPPGAGAVLLLGGARRFEVLGSAAPAEPLRHELVLRRRFGAAALVGGTCYAAGRPIARLHDLLVVAQLPEPGDAPFTVPTPPRTGAIRHAS
ncbi:MAG: hypothetical protein KIT35_26875 [Piscinibacter sp.]|uniref:hypothetical protein n=1 Tax=Piscinibacter TaxID=1114981 RepID=UPI000FDF1F2E|nr:MULTISPECIES: hypothetical protein [Piscinibacter]MCW5667475.1 hypothetical protein [Piscinibacter sp.]